MTTDDDNIAGSPELKRVSSGISQRNIAVVGCDGWIGTQFRRYLKNCEVSKLINVVNLSRSTIKSLNSSADKLRDYLEETNVVAIINFAGGKYSGMYNEICKDPQVAWLGDFELPRLLVKTVQNTGIELIQISTGDVYDYYQIPSYSTSDCAFSEDNLCNAVFQSDVRAPFFSGMKFLAEQIIRMHPYHYIFRIKHPIDMVSHNKNTINMLLKDSVIPRAEESFTFLPDLFRGILMVVLPDESISYGIYHIAIPELTSMEQLAKIIINNKNVKTLDEWRYDICSINEYVSRCGANISFSCLKTDKFTKIGGHLTPFEYIKQKVIPNVLNTR